jgi:hypothetical protein
MCYIYKWPFEVRNSPKNAICEEEKMTNAALLMKEIENLPEESMAEAVDFIVFLKNKPHIEKKPREGWETAFMEMRKTGEDKLIDPEQSVDVSFDWEW